MKYKNCLICKHEFSAANVFTHEGALETQISQVCEICFDALFQDDDDEYL